MRRVPITHLKENSIIASDIYDSKGNILITRNTRVNLRLIEALKRYNFLSVYIIDKYSPEILEDVISPELRMEIVMQLKKMVLEFTDIDIVKRRTIVKEDYLKRITLILHRIVDELINKDELSIQQIDIRSMENYSFSHAVNVAIISIIIGIQLKYDRTRLIKLATAALLHDVGKTLLPQELLYKDGVRIFVQHELLKDHCQLGYKYMSKFSNLDTEIKLGILQHHENIDGTGYPLGLKGDKINELAKIIAISNFYDNLIATGYMLKDNLPNNVLEQIMAYVGSSFDYNIVRVFYSKVKAFLNGTMVRLSNGDIAIVKGTVEGAPLRPIVEVIKSSNKENINKIINLVDRLDITIVELVYYIDK